MNLTVQKLDRPSKEKMYLIKREGVPVGFLSKFPNTRTEENPWKLFLYNEEFIPGETRASMVTVSYGRSFAESKKVLLRIAAEELEKGFR